MKKLFLFAALLMASTGLWAETPEQKEAVNAINNAASAAIAEIQNASTADYVKSIQDQAIADINEAKESGGWEITVLLNDPTIIKDYIIGQINDIKVKALADIKAMIILHTARTDAINAIKAVADSAKTAIDSLSTYPTADASKTKYKEKIDLVVEAATETINNETTTTAGVDSLRSKAIAQIEGRLEEATNEIAKINEIEDAKVEAIAQITSARQGILNAELNALINDAITSISKATTMERITEAESNIFIIMGMYLTGKAEALGSMAEPCTDCTAVKVKKGDKVVTLYAPDQVTYGEAVNKGE